MTISNTGAEDLRKYVGRIESLEEGKQAILDDITEIYREAKESGFTTKVIRKVIAERKKDAATRAEEAELFDTYWGAVTGELFGNLPDAPAPRVREKNKKPRRAEADA